MRKKDWVFVQWHKTHYNIFNALKYAIDVQVVLHEHRKMSSNNKSTVFHKHRQLSFVHNDNNCTNNSINVWKKSFYNFFGFNFCCTFIYIYIFCYDETTLMCKMKKKILFYFSFCTVYMYVGQAEIGNTEL